MIAVMEGEEVCLKYTQISAVHYKICEIRLLVLLPKLYFPDTYLLMSFHTSLQTDDMVH